MKSRDAALDGIRGLAALGVCLLHVSGNTGVMYRDGMFAWLTARLGIAVPIFFLLSGLLLYRPWVAAAIEGVPPPRTRRYYWRRVLRVMPAYWMVVVLALWAWSSMDWTGWATWLLLLQNYTEQMNADGLYQMWTLPIEMAFYLMLPAIAWALGRWAGKGANKPLRLLGGIAVLPVISIATAVCSHLFNQPRWAYWLPHHLIYFAAGMAMAVLVVWMRQGGAAKLRKAVDDLAPQMLVSAFLLYCALATELAGPRTLTLPSMSQSLWRMVLESAVAVLLVAPFALASRTDAVRNRVLGNPVSAYLGRISYSFFLWHAPIITLYYKMTGTEVFTGDFVVVLMFTMVITTVVSVVSYHVIEETAQRLSGPRSAQTRPPQAPEPHPAAPAP